MIARAILLAGVAVATASTGLRQTVGRVDITIEVVTSSNRAVEGLTNRDLSADVDGRNVTIESVSQHRERIAVVLLIDASASMPYHREESETLRYKAAVDGLLPALTALDQAQIGRVTALTTISPPLAHSRAAFVAALREIFPGMQSTSPIWDGVDAAVSGLRTEAGRRLILLVTDGRANSNVLSVEEVAERAVRAQTTVSVIDEGRAELVPQAGGQKVAVRADRALRWLAEATGGSYLPDTVALGLPRTPNPGLLVGRAVANRRDAYTMTLAVPGDKTTRSLKVSANKPGLIVRYPASIPGDQPRR